MSWHVRIDGEAPAALDELLAAVDRIWKGCDADEQRSIDSVVQRAAAMIGAVPAGYTVTLAAGERREPDGRAAEWYSLHVTPPRAPKRIAA